jgi:hypothetical protein
MSKSIKFSENVYSKTDAADTSARSIRASETWKRPVAARVFPYYHRGQRTSLLAHMDRLLLRHPS